MFHHLSLVCSKKHEKYYVPRQLKTIIISLKYAFKKKNLHKYFTPSDPINTNFCNNVYLEVLYLRVSD